MNPTSKSVCTAMMLLVCSCSTPAVITSSWHKSSVPSSSYNNIFVAAVTAQVVDKQMIEDNLQQLLQQKGVTVEKSMTVFPPKLGAGFRQRQDVTFSKIKEIGADGVLTVTLLRKDKEPHFIGLSPWEPLGNDYIILHADEFANGYPYDFDYNGYYKDDIVYYVETRFYNTKNRKLVWAGESKTYDPNNMNGFVKGYLETIYNRMVKDGVIASANVKM